MQYSHKLAVWIKTLFGMADFFTLEWFILIHSWNKINFYFWLQ